MAVDSPMSNFNRKNPYVIQAKREYGKLMEMYESVSKTIVLAIIGCCFILISNIFSVISNNSYWFLILDAGYIGVAIWLTFRLIKDTIKDTINNLKKAPIVKNTYTISESDRNKIIEYVDKVQDTNKDFKKTEMLSVTLNNVDTELQENREKIKILTENNKALTLKVDTLSKNIDNKNKEIKELKNDNKHPTY